MKHGKKYQDSSKLFDRFQTYDSTEALDLAVKTAKAKFDETVEVHVRLGVDSRHADPVSYTHLVPITPILPLSDRAAASWAAGSSTPV